MRPLWWEYDAAARACAAKGSLGGPGDPLPENLSARVLEAIDADPEAFARRVQEFAQEIARDRRAA